MAGEEARARELALHLATMLDRALTTLGGESGLLAVRDKGGSYSIGASKNLSERAIGRVQPLLDEIIPRIAQSRAFDALSELAGQPAERLANGGGQMRYMVLAPLEVEREMLGLLMVFRAHAQSVFGGQHRPLLDALTSEMASSLHSRQLLDELLLERERSEHLRSTFVSIVTHELQTPLSIIKGYASTLARRDVEWRPEVLSDSLHIIEEEADRLSRLVSDLLEVSQIETHGIRIEPVQVDLRSLFEHAATRLRTAHPSTPLELTIEGEPAMINVDPDRLEQVLINLVDNAIKYSPREAPVSIRLTSGPDEIQFSVADRGIGIPEDQRERIFERFYRVDNSAARKAKGTGLGLFIVRAIIEAHGGRIWVDSTPGQGSTFHIALPRGRGEI
ncbi:MAG TPA: ATP-binding protein [Chloroflexota bacterium]|nr:ATP-binding protein [Chloroflexota bacterium]